MRRQCRLRGSAIVSAPLSISIVVAIVVAPAMAAAVAARTTFARSRLVRFRIGIGMLHVAHDAVAIHALLAEMDRPAMGIATHAHGRVVARMPGGLRWRHEPRCRVAFGCRTRGRARRERQRSGKGGACEPARHRFHHVLRFRHPRSMAQPG
ncbi:MAG: hypothetical protein L0H23_00520 [Luteimonas sp.]|nr:hypothetical protein [Luteimonas sp.]